MNYQERKALAESIYSQGLDNVKNKTEPKGQKFPCGSRVRIADDLGPCMSHFTSGVEATVKYVYAHAYGGDNVKSYCLDIDGEGSSAWYEEWQLTAIDS